MAKNCCLLWQAVVCLFLYSAGAGARALTGSAKCDAKFKFYSHGLTAERLIDSHTRPWAGEGPPESAAIQRKGVILEGQFKPHVSRRLANGTYVIEPKAWQSVNYDGVDYLELPNSTAVKIMGENGQEREFIIARGVRPYKNYVKRNNEQSPKKYLSDVLMFENVNGKMEFRKTLLKSDAKIKFFFEDPRISTIWENGQMRVFLSGTDYAPHVKGSTNPDVMNRFVELSIDKTGMIQKVRIDPKTNRPYEHEFFNLSPKPQRIGPDRYRYLDAKNATLYQNADGKIVVRTRLRPDFNAQQDPFIRQLFQGKSWKYGEQVFVFDDMKSLQAYDWSQALRHLAKENAHNPQAKMIISDKDLSENFRDPRVYTQKGKGLGPGTIPVMYQRVGNQVFLSNGYGDKNLRLIGEVTPALEANFPIKEGETKFISFDHEIRYFKEIHGTETLTETRDTDDLDDGTDTFIKRHYSMSIKLWDRSLTHLEAYYSDALQPKEGPETGVNAGIFDLHHIYPMGRTLGKDDHGQATIRVFAGASDAHTTLNEVNPFQLLVEFGNRERWDSGQIYVPGTSEKTK